MTKLDKVTLALQCCSDNACSAVPHCEACPYVSHSIGTCLSRDQLFADALRLLQPAKPRLLTLDEVLDTDILADALWLQTKYEPDAIYHLQVYCQETYGLRESDWLCFNIPGDTASYPLDEYGQSWRCWSECPSDELRRKTPWDEGSEKDES